MAEAGPGQLELDLQVAGLSFGAALVLVDFLGLRVLKMLLWALVGLKELAPAALSPGHAGPEHLFSPVTEGPPLLPSWEGSRGSQKHQC